MSQLNSLVINDNGFGYDPFTGKTYSLNKTAQSILELLQKGNDTIAAATILAQHHNQPVEDTFLDVLDFCEQLKQHKVMR